MKVRNTLTLIVGIIQSVIAALVFIIACGLCFNFFDVQTLLDAAVETLYFHVSAILVFGFFSIISGLFLVHEWLESR